ncbi:nitrilase-related carbon-nitrogen hydrolase [Brachybacterium sp.]|uniref:nitrilase-related carbon-nitrogen hydrolase n=1 Tax=Brachybacterium sp. TaxID=1891286 RepID=UPI002ED14268
MDGDPVLRAAACQLRIDIDAPTPLEEIERTVADAAGAGARLIVLPELALSGYVFRSGDELEELAERPDGRTAAFAARVSAEHGCVLVAGFPERDGAHVCNSAVIADRGEVRGIYRKVHLWDEEKLLFTPGDGPPLVVDTSLGRVGVMICYDAEFPEWVRRAAQDRVDVLAVPVNWPLMPRPDGQVAVEVAKIRAAAAAYRVPMVVADRCGRERGTDWVGGSLVADAGGYLLAGPATTDGTAAAATVIADIDLRDGRCKALTRQAHVWGDRRPALYGDDDR